MSLKLGLRNKIRRSRAGGFTGLLDQSFATGATAAYSLRRLKSSATKAVRVREDNGNTEIDIGFSGGTLDETALLNHVGSNNGFVTKWYDQSGNGNDALNSTASGQPQIVNSGSVIKENGKPALQFDGSNDGLKSKKIGSIGTKSHFLSFVSFFENILSGDVAQLFGFLESDGDNFLKLGYDSRNSKTKIKLFSNGETSGAQGNLNENSIAIISESYNSSNFEIFFNGKSVYSTMPGGFGWAKSDKISIGSNFAPMKIFEGFFYPFNQSSNRTAINDNINNFYQI